MKFCVALKAEQNNNSIIFEPSKNEPDNSWMLTYNPFQNLIFYEEEENTYNHFILREDIVITNGVMPNSNIFDLFIPANTYFSFHDPDTKLIPYNIYIHSTSNQYIVYEGVQYNHITLAEDGYLIGGTLIEDTVFNEVYLVNTGTVIFTPEGPQYSTLTENSEIEINDQQIVFQEGTQLIRRDNGLVRVGTLAHPGLFYNFVAPMYQNDPNFIQGLLEIPAGATVDLSPEGEVYNYEITTEEETPVTICAGTIINITTANVRAGKVKYYPNKTIMSGTLAEDITVQFYNNSGEISSKTIFAGTILEFNPRGELSGVTINGRNFNLGYFLTTTYPIPRPNN
ncbi:hypothetical protein ACFL56_00675 [Candidatus Margulisiibacteriota bacterium]